MNVTTGNPNKIAPDRIAQWDHQYVWHPFTQMKQWAGQEPLVIVGGEREFLIDARGNRYIDGVSSMWCNVHGHNHPAINEAMIDQIGRISHSTLLGLTSPPGVVLARRLVEIAPGKLAKVFFSDNGSTAVEIACKMAFAYWRHRGRPERKSFVALRNAYHGDTIGAVSVGGIDLFHEMFGPLLFDAHLAPSPYCYRCELGLRPESCGLACAEAVGGLLEEHRGEVAAVVVEPLVQGAGGLIVAPSGHLRRVREICDEHDVLLVLDEVATGFGKTGAMFACDREEVAPDLMCVSKGLTSGYLPLAATLVTREIHDAFLGEVAEGKTFYHGHTYTGNQLGCRAALASLDLFESERTLEHLPAKVELMAESLARIAGNRWVGDVRQCGVMAGIELVADKADRRAFPYERQIGARVCRQAIQHGVVLRPLADVLVIMPPLCITLDNLGRLMAVVEQCIGEVLDAAE